MFKNIKNLPQTSFHSTVKAHWPKLAQRSAGDARWLRRTTGHLHEPCSLAWLGWLGSVTISESVKMSIDRWASDWSPLASREMTALWQLRTTHATHATHITHQEHSVGPVFVCDANVRTYDFTQCAQCAMWHRALSTLLHSTTTVALCQANSAVKSSGEPPCESSFATDFQTCKSTTWERPLETKTSPVHLSHYVLWGSKML